MVEISLERYTELIALEERLNTVKRYAEKAIVCSDDILNILGIERNEEDEDSGQL